MIVTHGGKGVRLVKSYDVLAVFQVFIDEQSNSKTKSKATLHAYAGSLRHLKSFATEERLSITFDNLTPTLVDQMSMHLRLAGMKDTTIAKVIKDLKVFCKLAYEMGYSTSLHYQRFKKPKTEATDFVYLTQAELQQLAVVTLPDHLDRVRDLFISQASTGLHHSDLSNLRPESRQGNFLRITTIKTRDALTIPLSPLALTVYNKHEGKLPKAPGNQAYNRELKEAFRLGGISSQVLITECRQGERIDLTCPKYEKVSSHTAGRTFIIHALERGVRPEVVMHVRGHKDIKTMMLYVKISDSIVEQEFTRAWSGDRNTTSSQPIDS